ncbi:unnamed protein product [Cyberlindnera jadinii]|uniref:C2H2-type domain-containing protein n=2 Tax=Cyberlindnera jadinii (strain ATCC 18201 / CBS 1600 / BCRC 20928 / JCM 3617 / NBRC 0987 / NRRL Y-1542) TaxID=983966 RepID=A0A0H5CHI6_CYBJN|nr:unnamed protein product [Cyberlindnera jadinii]
MSNSDEDEDRRFFRAAAEAIVASSMNSQIDPTIMELLRRIQYASLSKGNGSARNEGHTLAGSSTGSGSQQLQASSIASLSGLIDSTKATNFPTFNLDYFNIQDTQRSEAREENINVLQPHEQHSLSLQRHQLGHNKQVYGTERGSSANNQSFNNDGGYNSNNNNNNNNNTGNRPFTFPIATSPATQSLVSKQTPSSQHSYTPNSLGGSTSNPSSPSNGDEKPFQCQDCTLSFRRSSDLRRHQRAHLPVLPHICQQCGKGFARKDALKRHTDTLTCKRNRERLLSSGGDLESILQRGRDHI